MDVLRSVKIKRYSCVVPIQHAFETVGDLIMTGYVEIYTMLQYDTKNTFFMVLSRLRSLRLKLYYLKESMKEDHGMRVAYLSTSYSRILLAKMKVKLQYSQMDYLKFLDSYEEKIERKLLQLDTINKNYLRLKTMLKKNIEESEILSAKLYVFKGNPNHHRELSLLTGICSTKQKNILYRFIFRVSRGHSFVVFKNRDDQKSQIMFVFVPGSSHSLLFGKIMRFMQGNDIELYELPNNEGNLYTYKQYLNKKHKYLVSLVSLSEKNLIEQMNYYNSPQEKPRICKKLKKLTFLYRIAYIICHQEPTKTSSNLLLFNFHIPEGETLPTTATANTYPCQYGTYRPRTCMPMLPVLYYANLLTYLYSVPTHDEVIPSMFIFSTLPILFGVMYSDVGHGILLLSIAVGLKLSMVWHLMAVMSIYFGMLFNEFFGMKVGFFWWLTNGKFGVDPHWGPAYNALAFYNSLKMKLSIIIGSVHMLFGMVLRVVNERHWGNHIKILYETVPKIIVFLSTVGYMVFLILLKWTINFQGHESTSPSIISMVLYMYLGYGSRKFSLFSSVDKYKYITHLLKIIISLCLFSIMFGKSIHYRLSRPSKSYSQLQEDYEFDIGEYSMKVQIKEEQYYHIGLLDGFEFVLSLISSITSYLRLFALSLSHQKLSHLLLTFMLGTLSGSHPHVSVLRSFCFFIITILMMLMLDVMECIMHVIRLHWVEWMGKFYVGGGVKFRPEEIL